MVRRLVMTWVLGSSMALGCTSTTPPPEPERPVPAPSEHDAAPEPAPDPAMDEPDSDPNELQGLFDIDRIAGGKRFQGSWLHRADGESLVLSYRPMEEYFAFVEKRVVVTGERYSPQGQAIMAPHFRVESMRLAEGETARATIPDALPVPPVVREEAEVAARLDRWAQVVGTLVETRPTDSGSNWHDVVLRLADGTELLTMEASSVVDRLYRPRFGTEVTITGKLLRDDDGTLRVGGSTALCEGQVDGCGMTVEALRRF